MKIQQIASISNKINELKALFIFGQRVIPFLEELFNFVQEVIPLLDEINKSISDSTSKMPRASSQLSKVTQATEMAATEIFDMVDNILYKLGEMKAEHSENAEAIKKVVRLDSHILRLLRNELEGKNDVLLTKINQIHLEKLRTHKKLISFYDKMSEILDTVHDSTSSIMMSMQVQDITAQQIAAVNHLIESVEERLATLIRRFKEADDDNFIERKRHSMPHVFDPNATYDTSGDKQQLADSVFDDHHKSQPEAKGPASQDDIDKLFGAEKNDNPVADQDEIDRLFESVSDAPESSKSAPKDVKDKGIDGIASQDEIDKLFNNS